MNAAGLIADLKRRGLKIATAESCTGGLVAAALTDVSGSSEVFEGGIVAYSNRLKEGLLGVPSSLLAAHGAVSEPVARAMAEGALVRTGADLAISITGIAGPGGGSAEKPVGLVHFAAALKTGLVLHRERRYGDPGRARVRQLSVAEALSLAEEALTS